MLLDEQLNWRLRRSFGEGFEVETVAWRGWKGKRNGELLALLEEAGFDALVTTDKGIPHQQDLAGYGVAVVRLRAKTNRLEDTAPLVEGGLEKILAAPPGEATELP